MAHRAEDRPEGEPVPRPPTPGPTSEEQEARRRILQFITLFVIYVLSLLMGYRYSVDTMLNIGYMYQVARHTAFALSIVGDEGEVEPEGERAPIKPAAARRKLAQWRGEAQPAADEPDENPLTPWESWLYKAHSIVRQGGSLQDEGPIVYFVAREGLISRMQRVQSRITALSYGQPMDLEARRAEQERLREVHKGMLEERLRLSRKPEDRAQLFGSSFQFQLVPDCGAIPSMSIFFAAVLAFPTRFWKRLVGLLVGIPLLYGVNILRLTMVAYIGAFDTTEGLRWFNFTHEYVWQGVFIVFVVAIWMGWIEFLVRDKAA